MNPVLSHSLIAGVVQIASALILAAVYQATGRDAYVTVLVAGGMVGVWGYVMRERRQAEEGAGSNRISPLDWKGNPNALRDIAAPLVTCVGIGVLYWLMAL